MYVDGFVLAVPKDKLADYKKMARLAGKVWMEHGAEQYIENVEDDVQPGKHTSFPQAVKLKPGEVVVFSWIVYRSKGARNRINKKITQDRRIARMMTDAMPFDPKRMAMAGFKVIVDL